MSAGVGVDVLVVVAADDVAVATRIVGTRADAFVRTPTRPVYSGVLTVSVWVRPARAVVEPDVAGADVRAVTVCVGAVVLKLVLPAVTAARETVPRDTAARDWVPVALVPRDAVVAVALRAETARDGVERDVTAELVVAGAARDVRTVAALRGVAADFVDAGATTVGAPTDCTSSVISSRTMSGSANSSSAYSMTSS